MTTHMAARYFDMPIFAESVHIVFEPNGWYVAELICKDKHGNPHTEKSDIRPVAGEMVRCGECGGAWRQVMAVKPIEIISIDRCSGDIKVNGEFNPPTREKRHYGKYGSRKPAKEKKRKQASAFIIKHDGRQLSELERTNVMSSPDLIKVQN